MQISRAVISNSLMEYISSNFPAIFHSVYKTKEVRRTFLVAEMLDSRFPPKSHRKHTAVKKLLTKCLAMWNASKKTWLQFRSLSSKNTFVVFHPFEALPACACCVSARQACYRRH